jgi:transposase
LFSLQVDMVFYDLTSTYFEGKGPPEIGAHGHSRDGKPRNPQVLVGLVLVDGWPIAHHVFEGNRRDAKSPLPRYPTSWRSRGCVGNGVLAC